MTTTETLQAIADQWAVKLGGKIHIRLTLAVEAGLGAGEPWYGAQIGETCGVHWSGFRPDAADAITEAERCWALDGAPTDPKDAEKAKLKARAAELGMRVVEDEPERDEPVIYHRGELPPADTRTEHDKSL